VRCRRGRLRSDELPDPNGEAHGAEDGEDADDN